ncbi:acetylglutamate kinase [Bacillus sp. H-16]|uniref:acetylglutamate kinase n=1 Tax=Alteribacter salitolerans TaxID=2912333 RepID=UPI0019630978|nr:acetylglutamate kinase [Alteribacter salitolerans]MBM7096095.1 acetylglutamate kinase [Alteribacter salitolerans]
MKKYVVIKCGGSVLNRLPDGFYETIADLQHTEEWQPVIVHGGGPLISELLEKQGVPTTFTDGMRVTSEGVLEVVEMVLSGSVNKKLVSSLQKAGANAFGFSGVDGCLFTTEPMYKESALGLVGKVTKVKTALIDLIASEGMVPVISPVGGDGEGTTYNINGDVAAAAVAGALNAELCFISDIAGIYIEENGQTKTVHEMTQTEAESFIQDKWITGGMIPKVRSALDGLSSGVTRVGIVNGMNASSLPDFLQGKEIGTKITADKEGYRVG